MALIRELVTYEQRYHMHSAEFFAQYQEGKLGDAVDFLEWAGNYVHYVGLLQEIKAHLNAVG